MGNLEEVEKFLETYIPKLNQGEVQNLNRPVTSNKIELVIKKPPLNKSAGPGELTESRDAFYHSFKEELMTIFLKLFEK